MKTRIFDMLSAHQGLYERIRSEMKQRQPDWLKLQELKKLRLAIKDRLCRHTGPRTS